MKFQHIGPSQSPTNLPESFHLIYLFWSTKKKFWSWYYDVRSDKDFSSNYITKWKYIKVSQDLESWIFSEKNIVGPYMSKNIGVHHETLTLEMCANNF